MDIRINKFDTMIGKDIEGYYYLSDFRISSGKNGIYANAYITDATGTHTARMWGESISENGEKENSLIGRVIHVFGRVDAYDGRGSLIIGSMNEAKESEYKMSDICKCLTVEQINELREYIFRMINTIRDEALRTLVGTIISKYQKEFYTLPAGIKMHHNINGGLLIHTCEVIHIASQYCKFSINLQPIKGYGANPDYDMVIAGAVLHDIGKIQEYKGFPTAKITRRGELLGHLEIGTWIIYNSNRELIENGLTGVTEQKLDELMHIVLASHGDESFIAPKSLEALIVSFADNMSAQCDNYGVLLTEDQIKNPDDKNPFMYSAAKGRRFLRKRGDSV